MLGSWYSNDSLCYPNYSSIYIYCFLTKPSSQILSAYTFVWTLLFFPVCVFILQHGLREWMKMKRSSSSCSSSSAVAFSHSDVFAYHMAVVELVGVLGCILAIWGVCRNDNLAIAATTRFLLFSASGQSSLHLLTCAERYLAVVRPVAYRGLRSGRGLRIRSAGLGGVWLFCLVETAIKEFYVYPLFDCINLVVSLGVVLFCSVSVLRVLIQPGPGERGEARERVNQSKKRAFYTILAILGALASKCVLSLVWAVLHVSGARIDCAMMTCEVWFHLPSSLVLPLLFLHRKGKLACRTGSGQ